MTVTVIVSKNGALSRVIASGHNNTTAGAACNAYLIFTFNGQEIVS